LGEHFKGIVPNQTPEQFREFLSDTTICDKALAYLVDDGESSFFDKLTKFNSNEWTDMQESYIDYLQKNIVYMEHLKDKSFIEPSCIHYMLHEIDKNADSNNTNPDLIDMLKNISKQSIIGIYLTRKNGVLKIKSYLPNLVSSMKLKPMR